MKQLTSVKDSQTGIGLLEAIISVALSAIVILGAVYSTSKIMVSQRENNLHYIVVNELSSKMQAATVAQKESWCNETSKPTITLPNAALATITVSCPEVSITVQDGNNTGTSIGTSIPIMTFTEKQPMVFTVDVPTLGGDVKVKVGETL